MSCGPRNRGRRSLARRLTVWYAGMFSISAAVVFILFSLLIAGVIRERTDQDLLAQVRTFTDILRRQGVAEVQRAAVREAQAAGVKQVFLRLLYPTGEAFSSSNMTFWQDIAINRETLARLLTEHQPVFETIRIPDRGAQVRIVYGLIGPAAVLQAGQSLEAHDRIITTFWKIAFSAIGFLMVAAVLVGWFMARRALAGVAAVTATAARIAGGTLDERVPTTQWGDEIDQLAETFNRMLDRIEALVTGIRQMSDNIAHDLRSPITRIRGAAEVALTTGQSLDEYEQMAAGTVEDCDRLLDMINTMLVISRTETGLDRPERSPVDLAALARDACDLFLPLAEDGGVQLGWSAEQPVAVTGDRRMLQRLIANLLDNAIKYTPAGGQVTAAVATAPDGTARLTVRDSGIGIHADEQDRIFERFYRSDQSRSRGGVGLGLSLARTVARAHGGDISVTSTWGEGSTFTVVLPGTAIVRQTLPPPAAASLP